MAKPNLYDAIVSDVIATFYQSAAFGVLLSFLIYPAYLQAVFALREYLKATPFFAGFDHEGLIFTFLFCVGHGITYYSLNGLFFSLDYFQLLQKYKLHRTKIMQPPAALLKKAVTSATISQLTFMPLVIYKILYPLAVRCGLYNLTAPLPSAWYLFLGYIIDHQVNTIGFYLTHRLLHHKLFYSRFHKQHHEFVGVTTLASEYASPVEQIVGNIIPTLGGLFLIPTHNVSFIVWLVSSATPSLFLSLHRP